MIYIFHVDTGSMMVFEMNYALQCVAELKSEIQAQYKIPISKQVLLVSGGQVLTPEMRICAYSAGTDTNPIYMFSKTIIESDEAPRPTVDEASSVDYIGEVEKCLAMAPNYAAITNFTMLSTEFYEYARTHIHDCDKLVHYQHLQQQGWAAVVANMEDVTTDFQARADDFEIKCVDQLKNRSIYTEFLKRFGADLDILASIPILPALRLNAVAHPFNAFDELDEKSASFEVDGNQTKNEEDNLSADNDKGSNNSLNQSLQTSDSEDMEKSRSDKIATKSREAFTLLHWINIKENQQSLKHIAEYCEKAMEVFDGNVMSNLRTEIRDTLTSAKNGNMKAISGLEDRLSGLEKLMTEAKSLLKEQQVFTNRFQNLKTNAAVSNAELTKTLSESLRQELRNMLKNHLRLVEIKRRCFKAKDELAMNLYHRLKWIVYVENRMFETDSRLMFYHRSLARLKRHLAAVAQLHRAPALFCTAVTEIVRRREFSQAFLTWASDLASNLLTIHSEEVSRRRQFRTLFSGHFLGDLFPGTEDMPPPFATQAPKVFDSDLPKLTQSDIELLATRLPHIKSEIPLYDMTPVINFFRSRSGNNDNNTEKQISDIRLLSVTKERKESDRGCESETDTEGFVKLGQSPVDRVGEIMQLPVSPAKCDAATMSEVRSHIRQPPIKPPRVRIPTPLPLAPIPEAQLPQLECDCLLSPSSSTPTALSPRPPSPTSPTAAPGHRADFEPAEFYIEESPPETILSKKEEVDNLKEVLSRTSNFFTETLGVLKKDLDNLKTDANERQTEFKEYFNGMKNIENYITLNATRERETIQRITFDHELELNDINKTLEERDNDVTTLNYNHSTEVTFLKSRIKSLEDTVTELNMKISDMEENKQKDLKELQDRMSHSHKIEVESLRSRFRLVACTTSMDRSPSESSLEKIERTDMIEISNHKSILMQAQEDMELEKEQAIKRALQEQDKEWNQKLRIELENAKTTYDNEKQNSLREAMKRIIDEKDRKLERSQQRENQLLRDCMKYKETIEQLSDPETSDANFIEAKMCSLEEENRVLKEKCKKLQEKEQSIKTKPSMPKGHIPLGLLPKSLSISSCNTGDIVLVMWDGAHSNYTIFQESSSLFLLHGECLAALDLKINVKHDNERRLYAVGRVENKDFCVAVKTGNKFRVIVGQRFYRVKVRPLKPNENPMKDVAYCCNSILKQTDSSQKAVMRMTVSEAAGGGDNSTKSTDKYSQLTSSIYSVDTLTTSLRNKFSVFEPRETRCTNIAETNEPTATPTETKSTAPFSVAKFSSDLLKEAPGDVVDSSQRNEENKNSLEYNSAEWCSINRQDVLSQETDEFRAPLTSQVEHLTTGFELNEEIFSEIAEEAAP